MIGLFLNTVGDNRRILQLYFHRAVLYLVILTGLSNKQTLSTPPKNGQVLHQRKRSINILSHFYFTGSCDGVPVSVVKEDSAQDCIDSCYVTEECEWWNYDSSNSFCTQLSNCVEVEQSCNSCVYGQKTCGMGQPEEGC